ncbi:hypothetical protein FOVG_18067 [Fusarium oxysporum f. sp. pisi HDV247]|uniref:Histidine-specific methyltransferase SAM-dependent domain-containing protein n=1 Tax=Fusarium oxysporum f. sp. pisi HDV247 TaxID=1080344 RepID=W9ND09_FUSOX|nr:hypothetical protein FOVG_18067 [Fusarium oxysporum f. sp. pisi HDV247]
MLMKRRYNSPFDEYSAMFENQRQLATGLVTCLGNLSPGQVRDIGGGAMPQSIEKELNESIRLGKYLSKAVCYIDSPWPGGDTSPQSIGEKKILREQASELAQQLCPLAELTIFDLGSGNSEKLLPIFNELEKAEKVLQILRDWSQVVDRLILGQHEPMREKELESSYHTPEFTEFMRGGWDKANELLGWKEFDDTRWTLKCKTTASPQCHKFHCTPLAQPRTEFSWFACYKYTMSEFQRIIQSSGWSVSKCYRDEKTRMSMYNIIPAQKTDAGSLEGTPLARHGLAQTNKARIVCIFGLAENTKWIQDIPPITYVEGGKRYASTVDLAGGLAEGTLLGEEVVDLTVETLEDQWDSWNEPQKRLSALEIYKPLDEIEEQDTRLRIQIRDLVQTIAKSKGRNIKALIVTHGGKINTLTGHYRTQLELNNGEWELKSSSCFANLSTAVYKFSSATDEKAELVEVDESEYHAQLLGSDYQRPRGFTYIDSSGKAADERQLYEMFLKKTHEEVIARKTQYY